MRQADFGRREFSPAGWVVLALLICATTWTAVAMLIDFLVD